MVMSQYMGQSTIDSDFQDPGKNNKGQGYSDLISPFLKIGTMVPSIDEFFNSSPNIDLLKEDSPTRTEYLQTFFSESSLENPRLQNFRSRYQNKGFSEKSITLLLLTLDPNSTRTVSSNLRVWIHWCRTRTYLQYTVNSICEFFADKLNKGKTANIIAGYRSAISKIHEFVDGQTIDNHPNISKAIIAVRKEYPTIPLAPDIIDISPSLEYINTLGSNESMQLRDLSVKTAFLMALVIAIRPSDLVRLDLSTAQIISLSYSFECIELKEYKIALAHSAATTKSRIKSVYVGTYPDNPNLCPYSALQSLISHTDLFKTSNSKKRSIFLISRQPYTPASVDTVTNWIKLAMQKLSSNLTAKDVRSTSASLAQNAGTNLTTVLTLGNWSSNSTYQKFCQRDVRLMLEKNNVTAQILKEASNSYTV